MKMAKDLARHHMEKTLREESQRAEEQVEAALTPPRTKLELTQVHNRQPQQPAED